jgi:hypothetical protein
LGRLLPIVLKRPPLPGYFLVFKKHLGGGRLPFSRDAEELLLPIFIVGVALTQKNKKRVLVNLKGYRPVVLDGEMINDEELQDFHPLSLENLICKFKYSQAYESFAI